MPRPADSTSATWVARGISEAVDRQRRATSPPGSRSIHARTRRSPRRSTRRSDGPVLRRGAGGHTAGAGGGGDHLVRDRDGSRHAAAAPVRASAPIRAQGHLVSGVTGLGLLQRQRCRSPWHCPYRRCGAGGGVVGPRVADHLSRSNGPSHGSIMSILDTSRRDWAAL